MKIFTIARIRIKTIRSNKLAYILLILPLIFLLFMGGIYGQVKDDLRIPIVIIDEDNSQLSNEIISNLRANSENIKIIECDQRDFKSLIKDNEVVGIFLIEENFQHKIETGEYSEGITVYCNEDNRLIGSAIDIVFSEIIGQLSIEVGISQLQGITSSLSHNDKEIFIKSFTELSKELMKKNKYDLPIEFKDINGKREEEDLITLSKESVILRSFLSLTLMGFMIFMMFSSVYIIKDLRSNVHKRITTIGVKGRDFILGNALGIFIFTSIPAIIANLIVVVGIMNSSLREALTYIIIWLLFILSISLFVTLLAHLYMDIRLLQISIPILIIVIGFIGGGFFSVEILPSYVRWISYALPINICTEWMLGVLNNIRINATPYIFIMVVQCFFYYFIILRCYKRIK